MKISDNYFNIQSSINAKMKTSKYNSENSTENSTYKTGNANRDEIIISSKYVRKDSEDFAGIITKKIRNEVNTPVDQKTLDGLKSQIEGGTYNVDTDEIAKKIMLN